MLEFIEPADFDGYIDVDRTKLQTMIDDAHALAVLAAPCLDDPDRPLTANDQAAIKAVLRNAIVHWVETGAGALQQQSVGPFGTTFDTRQPRRGLLRPGDIQQLQAVCKDGGSHAYAIGTTPTAGLIHAEVCALRFGARYCSCGAVLTGTVPLYEDGGW